MPLLAFLFEATLISLSGVMSPGPITAMTVAKGNESPHSGALIAIGHGIIEIPLMVAIFYGVGYLLNLPHVKTIIAFVGGVFLLIMGIDMLRSIKQAEISESKPIHSPIAAGMLLSLGNPYFFIWWATVGAALILRSVSFGALGFLAFASVHWLCDFLWSYSLSILSFKGGRFFGRIFQEIVFAVCGLFLLFFGGMFILDGVRVFST